MLILSVHYCIKMFSIWTLGDTIASISDEVGFGLSMGSFSNAIQCFDVVFFLRVTCRGAVQEDIGGLEISMGIHAPKCVMMAQ